LSILFEKTRLNNLTLNNRFIRSATWTGMAGEDGVVTPKLLKLMGDLADGGVGLIITGHAYVHPNGIHCKQRPRLRKLPCYLLPDNSALTGIYLYRG